jgi:hypothetical protein
MTTKRDTPSLDQDPSRWIDREGEGEAEDRAAERLRGARALALPSLAPGHLRELRRRAPRQLFPVTRLAAAAVVVLVTGVGLGVAGASSGWFGRRWFSPATPAPREDRLEVAAGGAARLHRPGRWSVALSGPGTATVVDGDVGTVRLTAGTLTVSADAASMAIEAGNSRFRLAPGAVARVALSAGGDAEAITLAGQVVASTTSPGRGATANERASGLGEATVEPPAAPVPEPVAPAPALPSPVRSRAAVAASPPPEAVAAADEPGPAPPADVAPAAWPAPPLPADGDSEAAWLGRALTSLRREGDPAAAISILDRHAARFPASTLVAEVTAIRVEALLARGDDAAALAVLEAPLAARVSLGRSLRTLRGELLARVGRCADATRDFSAVLHAEPADAVDERALRGRAACAAQVNDQARLRADLELYLAHFADRPFAAEARSRLVTARPAP